MIGYQEELMDKPSASPQNVTLLLANWSHGEDHALRSERADDDFITK
jgi:hypothetical protein